MADDPGRDAIDAALATFKQHVNAAGGTIRCAIVLANVEGLPGKAFLAQSLLHRDYKDLNGQEVAQVTLNMALDALRALAESHGIPFGVLALPASGGQG